MHDPDLALRIPLVGCEDHARLVVRRGRDVEAVLALDAGHEGDVAERGVLGARVRILTAVGDEEGEREAETWAC